MISVDEARQRVLELVSPLDPVDVPLIDAHGLAVAHDLRSSIDLPPFTNSAMDGYAVRGAETAPANGQSPIELEIAGRILAGDSDPGNWPAACAIRIMTGALIPAGFDAVIPFEAAELSATSRLVVRNPVSSGLNVRPRGEDLRSGEQVVSAGDPLTAARIGLLAATGIRTVTVCPKPRVAILSTGDELAIGSEEDRGSAHVYDANGPMLGALISANGGEVAGRHRVADDRNALNALIAQLAKSDLIVSTGGISAGDSDVLRDFSSAGVQVDPLQVAMKPGKPLALGRTGNVPWIALPGNPVAAAVSFWQFVFPAMRTLGGHHTVNLPTIPVRVSGPIENKGGRRSFIRAQVSFAADGAIAVPADGNGSANLASFAIANALIIVPETTTLVEPGSILSAQLIAPFADQSA